jgi:hypothetical protein
MGVVMEMCVKHPGGPTRMEVTDIRGPQWPSVATTFILPARVYSARWCLAPPRLAVQRPRPHGFVSPGFSPSNYHQYK